jgi:uncharacterized OB-fold protein
MKRPGGGQVRRRGKAVPEPTPVSRPYWDAARRGELMIQRCEACSSYVFYPRVHCPSCGAPDPAWQRVSGRATLYSYVINHLPAPGFEGDVPYVIAVVELEEGPHMLTNLVDVAPDPAVLELDMPLTVVFTERDGTVLPMFRPATAGTGAGVLR